MHHFNKNNAFKYPEGRIFKRKISIYYDVHDKNISISAQDVEMNKSTKIDDLQLIKDL